MAYGSEPVCAMGRETAHERSGRLCDSRGCELDADVADKPTVGMSGMLFAMFGIMWGKTGRWKEYLKAGMPVILIMMLIPNVNGLLHLYCYILGFVFSFLRFKVS